MKQTELLIGPNLRVVEYYKHRFYHIRKAIYIYSPQQLRGFHQPLVYDLRYEDDTWGDRRSDERAKELRYLLSIALAEFKILYIGEA